MESGQERRFAVVTGASSGIGYELAKVFAGNGYDLLIAAEDEELEPAQRELNQLTASVESVRVDLSKPEGVEQLYERIQATARPVDAIALNAGIGAGGAFATETDLDKELRLIDLNVRSTVHLCKLVLGDMVERGEGRILFTSSIASTMPGAFQAVYNASKSFVQSFARAEMEDTKVGSEEKDDPAEVARQGFEALIAGEEKVVGGSFKNKVQTVAGKVIPDSKKAEMHRQMAEPGSGKEA
jgi:short-subunit dehydrogenase